MDSELQRQAQRRVDRVAAFRAELAELETEGGLVLTAEQRSRLDVHLDQLLARLSSQFGADTSESAKRISWAMRIGSFLTGVALFAALVLFCHRIWGLLSPAGQAGIAVLSPLVLLAGAEMAARRQFGSYYVSLLAIASGAAFIMGLNALGSTVNASPSANALLTWAVFALLLAYAYNIRLLLAAGLLLLCSFTGAAWMSWQGCYWPAFPARAGYLVPAAAIIYSWPWIKRHPAPSDFDFVYRVCGAGAGLVAVLIFSTSGEAAGLPLPTPIAETLSQIAGLLLSGAVVLHGLRLGRAGLVNVGAAGFVVFLFVRLHAWLWNWLPKYVFFLLVAMTALMLVLVFRHLHRCARERGRL